MKTLGTLALGLWLAVQVQARPSYSLYTDKKGKRVGDVITVLVTENAQASKNAGTTTDHENGFKGTFSDPTGILSKIPGWETMMSLETGTNNSFKGTGETQRKGELKAVLSVKIEEVLDNGNLIIKGAKSVKVNDETETIVLSGLIRPEDISSGNTILSNKIADAKIEYSGDGVANSAQQPGWISRFFNWLF